MLFNSLDFLVFLAVVYGMFLALPRRFRKWLLLAASWFFYVPLSYDDHPEQAA